MVGVTRAERSLARKFLLLFQKIPIAIRLVEVFARFTRAGRFQVWRYSFFMIRQIVYNMNRNTILMMLFNGLRPASSR